MKKLSILTCIFLLAISCIIADSTAKLKLIVTSDGFPSGHETAEGAACDLARAFIRRDAELFKNTCLRLYTADQGPSDYAKFLKNMEENIKVEATKKEPSTSGPKSIGKVFAARHLSKEGPASYGFATFSFKDIMFVDVGVVLQNDKLALNRTLVVLDKDGKWYVHPMPDVSPLLSSGLNDEKKSETDFSVAYDVQKHANIKSPEELLSCIQKLAKSKDWIALETYIYPFKFELEGASTSLRDAFLYYMKKADVNHMGDGSYSEDALILLIQKCQGKFVSPPEAELLDDFIKDPILAKLPKEKFASLKLAGVDVSILVADTGDGYKLLFWEGMNLLLKKK